MAGVDGAAAVDAAAADAAAVDGAAGAKTVMVDVGPNNSMSFSPAAVTINVGDTVTWNWQPSLPHSVTSGTPGAADGKFCSVPEGTTVNPANCMNFTMAVHTAPYTYSHTFATPGTFPYYCVNHGAAMTGTVTVQSSP
jgi:plastocyanin